MTSAQRSAIQQAYSILGEHFDASIIVVDYDIASGEQEQAHVGYWNGGSMRALGLCLFAQKNILESGKNEQEPE